LLPILARTLAIDNVLSGVRALLAKELVKLGYSRRETSEILGTSPAAVTLYSKDRRGLQLSRVIKSDAKARLVMDDLIEGLGQHKLNASRSGNLQNDTFPRLLDATYKIMRILSLPAAKEFNASVQRKKSRNSDSVTKILVERLQEEQLAAERNMALAVGTSDEVARSIFRQIASDSIRHAEIMSYLLNRQASNSKGVDGKSMIQEEISQIEAMIRGEENATEEPITMKRTDPAVKLLLKSIEMDEVKHKVLLKGLLFTTKGRIHHSID
jgi:uncharacterized protein